MRCLKLWNKVSTYKKQFYFFNFRKLCKIIFILLLSDLKNFKHLLLDNFFKWTTILFDILYTCQNLIQSKVIKTVYL